MNDGYADLYDDNTDTDDPTTDTGDLDPSDAGGDDPVSGDPGSGSSGQDPSDADPDSDGTDEQDTASGGTSSEETETGEETDTEEKQTPEDGSEDTEDDETVEGDETETFPAVDPEMLLDIRDTLHSHAGTVDGFTSGLTVSGNSLQVSFDSGTTALVVGSIDKQDQIIEGIDSLQGMLLLVFFVLVFDLVHRFAKRIVKNFMGGDKNGTNS